MADAGRRTCIELERNDLEVHFIPLDIEEGLQICRLAVDDFDQRYHALIDYPVEKAAQLYTSYARGLGATESALNALAKLTTVSQEDRKMATAKKAARAAAPVAKAASKKAVTKTTTSAKPVTKTATKTVNGAAAKKAPGERKPSAANKFQELIAQSKDGKTSDLTDAAIFAKVQKEFGLDDSKKSYVNWYRNHMRKNGGNPPAARAD